MLSGGGTKDLTYRQVTEAFYPMATSLGSQVDQEMTVFEGATHTDNLQAYYKLVRSMLLEPGWREDDLKRLKDQAINAIKTGLRGSNDEELGKEVLYSAIYTGTPYASYSQGAISNLERITLDDVKLFYTQHYRQSNLILGIAGGYSPEFLATVRKDFSTLPAKDDTPTPKVEPAKIDHTRALIVEKNTQPVAFSFGYPLDVKRGDPDYPALLLMQSYLGPHRNSVGHLYQRIREIRGINYGDYAYIEYFPNGMFQFQPDPNLVRRSQIFQIWIRPVEPVNAAFTLRLAAYELNKLITEGIPAADFDRTKAYLTKYLDVLTSTKSDDLGYAIDSLYYGIPNYGKYVKDALAKLTREQVNAAIKKHLRGNRMQIVAVSNHASELRSQLLDGYVATIHYNSPPPASVLEEDKIVGSFKLGLRDEDIRIVPVEQVFN
jgi:zinc protease